MAAMLGKSSASGSMGFWSSSSSSSDGSVEFTEGGLGLKNDGGFDSRVSNGVVSRCLRGRSETGVVSRRKGLDSRKRLSKANRVGTLSDRRTGVFSLLNWPGVIPRTDPSIEISSSDKVGLVALSLST